MNTSRTDREAFEWTMPRERYRELLQRSCIPTPRRRLDMRDQDIATLIELAELTVFAGGMLALLGYGLMWILE